MTVGRRCLDCGRLIDLETCVSREGDVKKPGDVSLCFYCGAVAIFTADGGLRRPRPGELEADPESLKLIARTQAVIRQLRARRN